MKMSLQVLQTAEWSCAQGQTSIISAETLCLELCNTQLAKKVFSRRFSSQDVEAFWTDGLGWRGLDPPESEWQLILSSNWKMQHTFSLFFFLLQQNLKPYNPMWWDFRVAKHPLNFERHQEIHSDLTVPAITPDEEQLLAPGQAS